MLQLVVDHQASSGKIKTHDLRIVPCLKLSPLCENLSLSLGQTWVDEECSLSLTKGCDGSDLGRHSKMLKPMYRSSSPFSLTDLDMWDTKSRFKAQVGPSYVILVVEQSEQSVVTLKMLWFSLLVLRMVWDGNCLRIRVSVQSQLKVRGE